MKKLVLAIMCLAFLSGSAAAEPVTGVYGGVHWNGATFSVMLTDVTGNYYTFVYAADFSSFTGGGHTDYITAINYKPTESIGGLVSSTVPVGWSTYINTNLSANNCAGSGSGFFCSDDLFPYSAQTVGSYTWTFTLALSGVTDLNSLVSGAPIRATFAEFNQSAGRWQFSNMSETVVYGVPEPSSLAFLGIGLLGAALGLRLYHK